MLTFVALFGSIAGEVDFGYLDWRVECDCCRRCATKSACCFFLSPCAPMILRAEIFVRTPCLDRDGGHAIAILDFKQAVASFFPDVQCYA